ncbi:MAG: hypothetical protein IT379_01795 [Deltaproteobacteria bacterium]|nr:hypothetical protein [Deltaproteobacteria bacterium]
MTPEMLLEKIAAAKVDIAAAEETLAGVIRDIAVVKRAEKTVSQSVQEAFVKLRAALDHLSELETMLASAPPRRE